MKKLSELKIKSPFSSKPKIYTIINKYHKIIPTIEELGERIPLVKDNIQAVVDSLQTKALLVADSFLNDVISLDRKKLFEIIYISSEFPSTTESRIWWLKPDATHNEITFIFRKAIELLDLNYKTLSLIKELDGLNEFTSKLNAITLSFTSESELGKLLDAILYNCRYITNSDAGSLYVVEDHPELGKVLRFVAAQNDSVHVPFKEKVFPINNKSLAGYVALMGEILNIPNVEDLEDPSLSYNKSWADKINYRIKSMLVIPLKNTNGDVIGVLQLMNRKSDFMLVLDSPEKVSKYVSTYSDAEIMRVNLIASHAAIAIEKAIIYKEIENLLDGFMNAALSAIELRDPVSFGHSRRVTEYVLALAKEINESDDPSFKHIHFGGEELKELEVAALLHDFGKIAVKEKVLTKKTRLSKEALRRIEERFSIASKLMELVGRSEEEIKALKSDLEFIKDINKRNRITNDEIERLNQIKKKTMKIDDLEIPMLSDEDYEQLSVPYGNLTEKEWEEMRNHVMHTFRILSQIPWTRHLKNVPYIAHLHHENLDGSGYPYGKSKDELPLTARMIALADRFDALTAIDRPYKGQYSIFEALEILRKEVEEGKLDADLFKLFERSDIPLLLFKKVVEK